MSANVALNAVPSHAATVSWLSVRDTKAFIRSRFLERNKLIVVLLRMNSLLNL